MKPVSRWAMISILSILTTYRIYLLAGGTAERMVATGQGWEMAFYWSPLVFLAIDVAMIIGMIAGFIGIIIGPELSRRLQAVIAMIACIGIYQALPWR